MFLYNVPFEYFDAVIVVLITMIVSAIYYHSKSRIIIFKHDSITTKIVSDTTSCSKVLNELIALTPYVLGIDCEWIGKHKISLLQIAHRKLIILIRLHKLKTIPSELIALFTDNKIFKCGVGIYNDAAKLRYDYNIDTFGCVDINDIFGLIPNNQQILTDFYGYSQTKKELKGQTFGLNKFSKILLNKPMKYKNKKITTSNWEKYQLTKQQCYYAADDALIGYKLFTKLMKISNINDNEEDYMNFCYGAIDIHHYIKKRNDGNYCKKIKIKSNCSKQAKSSNKTHDKDIKKKRNEEGKNKSFFDNCKILKPNGDILSCCSIKGMRWYLKKNLAEIVDEKTIKLNFEPKIKGLSFDEYHQSIKTNECFVCGKTNNLCKFAVVPECYRQYIQNKYNDKAWRIHDHIPLCIYCHKQAMHTQDIMKNKLCNDYCIPHYRVQKKSQQYTKLYKAKKASYALSGKQSDKIPIKRKIVLLKEICDFYKLEYQIIYLEEKKDGDVNGYDELIKIKSDYDGATTTEILNRYIDKLNVTVNENLDRKQWQLHSKKLMEVFQDNQVEFIEMWRKAFVDQMKPRFLPKIWSVSASDT